jgi:hypothetical protein
MSEPESPGNSYASCTMKAGPHSSTETTAARKSPLSDPEVEEAIALMPRWPVEPEIEDVWLLQTEKARVWQENEHRQRFDAGLRASMLKRHS